MSHKSDFIAGTELEMRFGDARRLSAARQAHFAFFYERLGFAARFR